MKQLSALLLTLILPASTGLAELLKAPESVEQWDYLELTLSGPEEGNPFLEVDLNAIFSNGHREVTARGFYDGDGVYKIRFMPEETGTWRFKTWSNAWALTAHEGDFLVTPAAEDNHGPVRVYRQHHFAYADGTVHYPFGTTTYNWLHRPRETQRATIETLRASPFNKLRMLIFPEGKGSRSLPRHFPFEGDPPADWDFTRFNPEFFQQIEERLLELREIGVEADLILFHKYGSEWTFDTMPADVDDRYLRYIVARLAAFRNVWWSMANEYDFVKTKKESDWDRYFQIVQAEDPYNHLRSIHNGFLIYDHNKPWVTHASIQNGAAVEEPGRAQMYLDVWRKPVVYDEVKYEGDNERRWGNLSGEEMAHRVWCGIVAGTYVGHGECYNQPDKVVWLSTGGRLHGTSPERIGFLRDILESGPGPIDQVDKWQDTRLAGIPGEFYLKYFGREAPEEWTFQLPRAGLRTGQVYTVDVIDTWAMTITPVEGTFTLERKDRYHFVDENGRVVDLPDKSHMALRIVRVGGEAGQVTEEDPNL